MNEWYSAYHPHDVDTFYEDLVARIAELVDKKNQSVKAFPREEIILRMSKFEDGITLYVRLIRSGFDLGKVRKPRLCYKK